LQALSAAVVSKEIDGFFVQYEYQARIPNKWPDGKTVRVYRSHKGLLYFRPGAWTNYGFKNEAAFQRALKTGGVSAKTAAGALSLGLARRLAGKPLYGSIRGLAQEIPQTVLLASQEEADDLREMLVRIAPEAVVDISAGPIAQAVKDSGLLHPRLLLSDFRSLDGHQRTSMILLGIVALLCCSSLLAAMLGLIPHWVSIIAVALFPVCMIGVVKGINHSKNMMP